jgi:hypothetical protein
MSPYYCSLENLKNPTNPKNPKTPRTQSAFGLLTIKHQSRPSYGIRPEVSSILEIVELGFEAFALSFIFNLSQAYLWMSWVGERFPTNPFQ